MKRQSGSLNKYSMDTCSKKTAISRLFTYLVINTCYLTGLTGVAGLGSS